MTDHTKGLLITMLGVLFIVPDSLFIRLIDADTLTLAFWRNFISGSVVIAGLIAVKGRGSLAAVRATGWHGALYAACVSASGILFVAAVNLTSVANVVFIIATMPIFAAIFSWIALGERISRRTALTIAAVAAGLAVIAYGSGQNEATSFLGDALAVLVAATFAVALTAARQAKDVSMIPAAGVGFFTTSLVLLPLADIWQVPPAAWWIVAVHGSVVIVVSMCLLSIGPRYLPSAEVSLLILLESILAPLLVWGVLGEYPGEWVLVGGAMVISALLVSNLVVLGRKRPA
jgi:drug/metabolite transporter (DMT)-like permease